MLKRLRTGEAQDWQILAAPSASSLGLIVISAIVVGGVIYATGAPAPVNPLGTQFLDRDRGVWGGWLTRAIETQLSTIWAITEFNDASARRPPRVGDPEQVAMAAETAARGRTLCPFVAYMTNITSTGPGCRTGHPAWWSTGRRAPMAAVDVSAAPCRVQLAAPP